MKVIKARSNLVCGAKAIEGRKCPNPILKGESCIKVSFLNKNHQWGFFFAHSDCYVQQLVWGVSKKVREFDEEQARKAAEPKRLRGRPTKTSEPDKYRRLKSLWRYYEWIEQKIADRNSVSDSSADIWRHSSIICC